MRNARAQMFAVLALCSGVAIAASACDAYDESLVASDRKSQRKARRDSGADADMRDASASEGADAAREEPTDAAADPDGASSPRARSMDGPAKAATASTDAGAAEGGEAAADAGESAAGSGGPAAGGGGGGSAASAGTPAPAAPCTDASGRVWEANGHCYFPLTVMNSWYVSRDRCRELGAHLASITSAEEQAAIGELVGAAPRWIGLSRFGAPQFSWVDGENMTYENWEEGSPKQMSQAAVALRNGTSLWFDDAVERGYGAICERELKAEDSEK